MLQEFLTKSNLTDDHDSGTYSWLNVRANNVLTRTLKVLDGFDMDNGQITNLDMTNLAPDLAYNRFSFTDDNNVPKTGEFYCSSDLLILPNPQVVRISKTSRLGHLFDILEWHKMDIHVVEDGSIYKCTINDIVSNSSYYQVTITIDSVIGSALTLVGKTLELHYLSASDAENISYTPTISSNWSVVPTNVYEALDSLAARPSGGDGGGGGSFVYSGFLGFLTGDVVVNTNIGPVDIKNIMYLPKSSDWVVDSNTAFQINYTGTTTRNFVFHIRIVIQNTGATTTECSYDLLINPGGNTSWSNIGYATIPISVNGYICESCSVTQPFDSVTTGTQVKFCATTFNTQITVKQFRVLCYAIS